MYGTSPAVSERFKADERLLRRRHRSRLQRADEVFDACHWAGWSAFGRRRWASRCAGSTRHGCWTRTTEHVYWGFHGRSAATVSSGSRKRSPKARTLLPERSGADGRQRPPDGAHGGDFDRLRSTCTKRRWPTSPMCAPPTGSCDILCPERGLPARPVHTKRAGARRGTARAISWRNCVPSRRNIAAAWARRAAAAKGVAAPPMAPLGAAPFWVSSMARNGSPGPPRRAGLERRSIWSLSASF